VHTFVVRATKITAQETAEELLVAFQRSGVLPAGSQLHRVVTLMRVGS
jgi:hypothetical protein